MRWPLVVLVCLSVLAAGCDIVRSVGGPRGELVKEEWHGGRCPEGECRGVVVLGADGLWRGESTGEVLAAGVAAEDLARLGAEMDRADFGAIRSVPFAGECPTAFDGQEIIYTFFTAHGPERIATCETTIDPDHPLFRALAAAEAVRIEG